MIEAENIEEFLSNCPSIENLSAARASQHHLTEFRPLAYLPKPFALSALLHLAAEVALRREGNTHAV